MKNTIFGIAALAVTSLAQAEPLMDRAGYIDYSARQHCINQQYWDQPLKQEQALVDLEKELGISEGDYSALDELAMTYDQDAAVQEAIEVKARELCPANP